MIELPKKMELNGADCFHLLLENFNKSNTSSNNTVRMIITFKDSSKLDELIQSIENSKIIQWISQLRLEHKPLKSPIWIHDEQKDKLKVVEHSDSTRFSEVKNIPFDFEADQLIRFDILNNGNDFKLLFSWHHIIMDGRGAGLLIQSITNNKLTLDSLSIYSQPKDSKSFKSRFSRMFDVKHFVEDMLKNSMESPELLHPTAHGFHHDIVSFSEEESKVIEQNALQTGCKFGINMFQLACCFLTYKKVMSANKKIWVPVPYDGRKRGSKGPVIGNHISFLFYQIDPNKFSHPKEVVTSLNQQMNN